MTNSDLKTPSTDLHRAERLLSHLQSRAGNGYVPALIAGDRVMIYAEPGNMFVIQSYSEAPDARALLIGIGEEPRPVPDGSDAWLCRITWDTALHYLARPGHLSK